MEDPNGTQRLLNFFNGVLEPEYGIAQALADENLTPYQYFIRETSLNDTEKDIYNDLRLQIREARRKAKRDENGNIIDGENEWLEKLYRDAAMVIKKAANKTQIAVDILTDENFGFNKGEHWLVYCEDGEQLEEVKLELIGVGLGSQIREYRSETEYDLDGTLDDFREYGGILLSIKCLDQGVDIKEISRAVILASTQNPRQYVQRRGRVLRLHDGKNFARIWDVIVIPSGVDEEESPYVLSELRRAKEFAATSMSHETMVRIDLLETMFM